MVDPTNDEPTHPLTQPRALPDTATIRLRYRPRFTTTEAVILNTLVNHSPDMVKLDDLRRIIGRSYINGMPVMESSVKQAMVNLRAKIGEKAWNPTQIRSVYRKYKAPGARYAVDHLVGYRWVDPYSDE